VRGFRPSHNPVEVLKFLTGLGLKHPTADFGVELVAGTEQMYENSRVREPNPASLGQRAPSAHPRDKRAKLPNEHRLSAWRLQIIHGLRSQR
jgi:hypothetical protein